MSIHYRYTRIQHFLLRSEENLPPSSEAAILRLFVQSQGNLATLLQELGDDAGALTLLDECVPLMVDKLGQSNPITGYFSHVRDDIAAKLEGRQ